MKKILSIILCLAFVATMFTVLTGFTNNDITVEIDGKAVEFDVTPQIIDGHTMVPLRKILEEIGALVKWDNDTRTVTARKSSKTLTLTVDSPELQIDSGKTDGEGNPIIKTVTLEVPAQIIENRTLVPIRDILENFGYNVDWDEKNQKVIITSDEEDESWKENKGTINLTDMTFEGNGIEIDGKNIKITSGGDYTVTGTLTDGNITVSTEEKVKLRLSGVSITSSDNPCIFIENADKAYITLTDKTENCLVCENCEDGAIYSKSNLEIKGKGTLSVISKSGHAIKASDNLSIENGNITLNAFLDGIHINDTFKMTGGTVNITAVGDGIDSESIVDILGGTINIETNGVPVENSTSTDSEQGTNRRGMWEQKTDVEFEKSSKGINAEWMMRISGGEINVNSASHTIHCEDEIQIDGGTLTLNSKYDKGISAHGNLTVNGSETIIDVTKSTEGLESKNIMTINDGIIKVVSSDDALNATGGKSGEMMFMGQNDDNQEGNTRPMPPQGNADMHNQANERPMMNGDRQFDNKRPPFDETNERPMRDENREFGNERPPFEMDENGEMPSFDGTMPQGFMDGMQGDMKDCLIINGGMLELYAEDDCLDSNGNIIINGGTIKATNPNASFSGAFGIIDPDGQTTISENANLIFAAGRGSERNLNLTQNSITVYLENSYQANDKITLYDKDKNVIYEYTPIGTYNSVLISSSDIKTGEKYVITIGTETFETTITEQSTVIGTNSAKNLGFGRTRTVQ